ncbi:hypothetical protein HB943_12055 [Listeria weihenstephanensis]|uniref:Uncharacterized protein n=1 Tax=Listeria weihenstephanensis TaxID=1006155 RepID=A0A841ZA38_9LIST|nr:immunoglobulin-like domain-containing protein [Listeria weihenstephanensis]MBC1501336.1 hypothetical protein [Listeria weihenstephanensis]
MKFKKKFGLKVLSVAMIASLMVPTSIGNIVFAETAVPQKTESISQNEQTFSHKKEYPIKKGTDDVEVSGSAVNLTSTGLDLHGVVSGVPQATYLRFADVTIPSDAKISNAYISFTTRDASSASQSTTINITGEIGTQAEFTNTVASFNNRTFTKAAISMTTPVVATNTVFNTNDVSSILNEMRANTADIQNYVFKVAGSSLGAFVMRSYESNATLAPKLIVEYTSPSGDYTANISNTSDDAEETGVSNAIQLNAEMKIGGYASTTLTPANKEISGFRFGNVELPENAEIEDAYLEFTTRATVADRVSNMVISSELGNPATYANIAGNISQRNYTSSTIKYQQPSFTTANQAVRTPNLKNIIDETRLMGWENGSALAFKVDGDNYIGSIYQAGSTAAYQPKLVIKYKYSENGAVSDDLITDPAKIKNVFINEVASMGTDAGNTGWIELFNNNDAPVFFQNNVFLSDDAATLDKSELKNLYIPAKGYRIVKADGTQNNASANFTLGDRATKLYLSTKYNNSSNTIDSFDVRKMNFNETIGRFNDGDASLVTFKPGTYGSSNNAATPIVTVTASQKTGIYAKAFDLTLTTDSINTIKYTTDGSIPSETNGTAYTKPITIDKNMTVKAFAYNAKQNSGVQSYTYSIREDAESIPLAKKEYTVKAGTDDAAVTSTSVNSTSTGLNLNGVLNAVPQSTFVRFADVSIPEDAVITKAHLVFTTRDASSTPTNFTVTGEIGNGDAFATTVDSFNNRKLTNSAIKTATPAKVAANDLVNTDDLTPIIEEMRSANPDLKNLVFKVDGDKTGAYIARSYESSAAMAPKLVLEYYSGSGDFSGQVATASDDAEEYGTAKAIELNASLRIGGYYAASLVPAYKDISAFRFANVTIPESAEIEDAYMEFTADATTANKVSSNLEIRSELGNPETYKSIVGDITSREYGNLAVKYSQPAFATANQTVRTANLKDIINENRLAGWKDGQAMAFRLDGDNYIGSVFQGGSAKSARLIIKYKNSGKGPSIEGALTTPDKIKNVYINELSSEGTANSKAAWIELYNDNDVPVILDKGMYITDKTKTLDKFEFSNLLIPAKGYRVLYSDKAPELGNNHLSFEIGGSGDVVLSAKIGSEMKTVDSIKYTKQSYNQSFGRVQDGSKNLTLFTSDTFGKSNNDGQVNYVVTFSKERGMYDTGFDLTLSSKAGTTLKYTLDGSDPSATKGTTYTGPITINKTTVVKVYGYDATGNTGVISSTYVLRDNYKNEVISGYQWQFKNTITSEEYAKGMSDFPVVSVTGDASALNATTQTPGTFEFLDTHMNSGGTNFFSYSGAKKFGQVSAGQYNSGVSVKFHRDYGAKKAKYSFFDPVPGDAFPVVNKFSKLELKEGQDGPQNDVFNLGYNRYDETVTNTLAKQMGKIALSTKYVHYFYNGKYMGVKTMREDFGQNMFEEYFGGDDDDYTKIRFQDGYFVPGIVESGDGDTNILTKVKAVAAAKNFQEFKNYVDVEDLIKTQILFMFVDTEQEVDAVVSNDILNGSGTKMKFNINDTDGAFYNNGGTGTSQSALAGGGGTYRYKWNADYVSRRGAGALFGSFSGDSTTATAGNLEFKTLVKDQVLAQIGPANGNFTGTTGAPLSVNNVQQLILDNQKELDSAYKLDAAFMGARSTIYKDWLTMQTKVQSQMTDRVKFSLEMWLKYNMAHTLQNVNIVTTNTGVTLDNPNANTDVYYTTDGSDPMGADGVVSSKATKYTPGTTLDKTTTLTVRAFTTNNWGPMIDNALAAEQAKTETAAKKAVSELFADNNPASGSLKDTTDQKAIDAAQKAVDAVSDTTAKAALQKQLNTAAELLKSKTSGSITTNDFSIGKDNYVKGTYTGAVSKIGLEINGTSLQIINVTGSPYQYYAKGKINATTDIVYAIGYDANGKELQKTKVNVQKQTSGQLTPNTFYLGKDNYVTGQLSGDIAKISLTVNGTEGTKIGVTAPDFKYYANNLIRNLTDVVKITAYDTDGQVLDTKSIIVAKEVTTTGAITSIATFNIGKDNYITGQLSGDITKISLTVNNVESTKISVTAPGFKYYANNVIRNQTDIVKITGYDSTGKLLDTKTVTIAKETTGVINSVSAFNLGKDGYVTGTYTDDIARVELQVNNVTLQRINVTDGIIKYYAKTSIKQTSDIVKLVGYNTAGVAVSTKTVPVISVNGTITANPFLIGVDSYVKGQYTGDIVKISLTVNGAKQTTINVPIPGPDFQYYAKTLIKNETDIVVLTAYDAIGTILQTSNIVVYK